MVVQEGNHLAHWWHDNSDVGKDWLTLLFGDSRPHANVYEAGANDSVAVSTDVTPPTEDSCPHLKFSSSTGPFPPPRFEPPLVTDPGIYQGDFNVPASGFARAGRQYAIFWTNHCASTEGDPPHCGNPHQPGTNLVGNAVMTRLDPATETYQNLSFPPQIAYTGALSTETVPGFPATEAPGAYVWGVHLYRGGNPILALIPPGPVTGAAVRYLHIEASTGARSWVRSPGAASDMVVDRGGQGTGRGRAPRAPLDPLPAGWCREAAEILDRGAALDHEDLVPGVCCAAVPLHGPAGRTVAALCVLADPARPLPQLTAAVTRAGPIISRRLRR